MQLKMESSNTGKSKQQQPPPQPPPQSTSIQGLSSGSAASSIASSVSPTTTTSGSLGSAQQQQQHQNGSSSSGPILPNGAKYRARPTMPVSSTSSLASPSVNLWQQQYRFVNTLPLRILVLKDLVGAIIGRGGGTIKQITQETHARVDVHRKESSTANENVIMIYGNPENCSQACRRILEVMQQEARSLNRPDDIVLKLLASNNLIGRIIGKGGQTIKRIMQQTDTKITVSSANFATQINLERIISITGILDNICRAEVLISQKLRQCFENDMYQYQQSLMYGGLHSPMTSAHPVPLSSGFPASPHPSQAQSTLPYSIGPGAQAPPMSGGRPGPAMPVAHPGPSVSSVGGPGAIASHLHHGSSSASSSAFYGGYNLPPYLYSASGNFSTLFGRQPGPMSVGPLHPSAALYFDPEASMPNIEQTKETVTVFIPNSVVGALIGRGGQTIREMMNQSGANIKVTQMTDEESTSFTSTSTSPDSRKISERKVAIVGTANAQYQAQYFVYDKVYQELYNQAASTSPPIQISSIGPYGDPSILKCEILVPTNQVRRIIGKSGSVIQELQRITGATIKLTKESQPSPSTTSCSSSSGPAISSTTPTTVTVPANGQSESSSIDKPSGDQAKSATVSTTTSPDLNEMTAVHIIGDFSASIAAQRQIRLIVQRSTSNVPSTSQTMTTSVMPQHKTGKTISSSSATTTKTISSTTMAATTTSSTTTGETISVGDESSKSTTSTATKLSSSSTATLTTTTTPPSTKVEATTIESTDSKLDSTSS